MKIVRKQVKGTAKRKGYTAYFKETKDGKRKRITKEAAFRAMGKKAPAKKAPAKRRGRKAKSCTQKYKDCRSKSSRPYKRRSASAGRKAPAKKRKAKAAKPKARDAGHKTIRGVRRHLYRDSKGLFYRKRVDGKLRMVRVKA